MQRIVPDRLDHRLMMHLRTTLQPGNDDVVNPRNDGADSVPIVSGVYAAVGVISHCHKYKSSRQESQVAGHC